MLLLSKFRSYTSSNSCLCINLISWVRLRSLVVLSIVWRPEVVSGCYNNSSQLLVMVKMGFFILNYTSSFGLKILNPFARLKLSFIFKDVTKTLLKILFTIFSTCTILNLLLTKFYFIIAKLVETWFETTLNMSLISFHKIIGSLKYRI